MDTLLLLINALGKEKALTIRQLSLASGIPYTTALRTIKKNASLFSLTPIGNVTLAELSPDPILRHYLIIAERTARERFYEKQKVFSFLKRDIPEGDYCLLLFGSRAKGGGRKESDADFCVIGKASIPFKNFEILSGIEANPLYLTPEEYREMLDESSHTVAKEIAKNHIILHGEELFWSLTTWTRNTTGNNSRSSSSIPEKSS